MFRKILAFFTLALALPLAACDDGTSVGEPGFMSLQLTDEAGDFTQARVVIERIELVGDDDADTEPGIVLMDEPFSTNLLTLSNDIESLVEDETIPAGTYAQLRFIIPDACIGVEQEDGSEMIYASTGFDDCGTPDGALQLPSYGESGLKINLPGGAIQVDGDAYVILLDFDVAESFGHQAGNSGMWVMTPVIHATDISLSASITVELSVADTVDLAAVSSSLADFETTLDSETEPLLFADDDEDGVFTATFLFLMPDEEYEVSVGLQEDVAAYPFTLNPESPQTVSLASGQQATVSFEVTSAGGS